MKERDTASSEPTPALPAADPEFTASLASATPATDGAALRNSHKARNYWTASLTVLLMALILGWLLYRERASLSSIDIEHAWPRLLAGLALMLVGLIGAAWVWGSIMRALGSHLAMVDHIHVYASTYLSRYLPGTVWYIVGRGAFYRMEGESARSVTVGSAIELLLSTVAGALLALTLALLTATQRPAATLPVLLVAVGLAAVALHPRVLAWIVARLRLAPVPPLPRRALALWLAVDLLAWLIGGIIFWLIANEVGGAPPSAFAYTTFAWTLVGTLSVFIFFLPSNFGLTEVGLSLLLSAIMPSSVAVVVAVLSRVFITLFAVISCGLIVAATARLRRTREVRVT